MKSLEGFGSNRTLLCSVYANLELGSSPQSPIIPFLSAIKSDDIAESHLTRSWRLRSPVYYLLIIEMLHASHHLGAAADASTGLMWSRKMQKKGIRDKAFDRIYWGFNDL